MKNILKITYLILFTAIISNCTNNETQELNEERQLLQLIEKSDLNNLALFVYELKNDNINYELKDGWEVGWSDEILYHGKVEEVCRGSGLSFAKCVKKAVDSGKCVIISADGSEYVATLTKCPNEIAPPN
ncbi:hypothetical protein [Psychroserpens algicola]|uniref:DUF4362 domain-containing protein n=1 Tax=Psychroserpens algicola TaxID=1719034 RepID=A0ABT0HBG7_9FLAO|nr:hypothetical protein [Psychroserpens algicola]MCK8481715.1 hypothetical protein [Psychroserpens algicola]